jgi:RNA recognition motif-containing protein
MSQQIYVGNLSWNTSNEALRLAFEPFGKVTEARWQRWDAARKQGLGCVSFERAKDAAQAISAMNDHDINGQLIQVGESMDEVLSRKREKWR